MVVPITSQRTVLICTSLPTFASICLGSAQSMGTAGSEVNSNWALASLSLPLVLDPLRCASLSIAGLPACLLVPIVSVLSFWGGEGRRNACSDSCRPGSWCNDGLTYWWFELQFFDLTMVSKRYAFNRNHTSSLVFPRLVTFSPKRFWCWAVAAGRLCPAVG